MKINKQNICIMVQFNTVQYRTVGHWLFSGQSVLLVNQLVSHFADHLFSLSCYIIHWHYTKFVVVNTVQLDLNLMLACTVTASNSTFMSCVQLVSRVFYWFARGLRNIASIMHEYNIHLTSMLASLSRALDKKCCRDTLEKTSVSRVLHKELSRANLIACMETRRKYAASKWRDWAWKRDVG